MREGGPTMATKKTMAVKKRMATRKKTPRRTTDADTGRMAALLESSVVAIFTKDLDGIIQTWNPAAERLYGYTRAEAVGRSVEMLIPPDRIQEFAAVMAQLRRGKHVEELDTERIRKDGKRIP